jgi:D-methionine transport system permease protein
MSAQITNLTFWALIDTLVMTGAAGLISLVVGLPIGLVLVCTDRGGIVEAPTINRALAAVVNALRSIPFIILMVALIPLTRIIAGTSIGTAAAIVPLSIAAIPFFARISEVALREIDGGLVEAARAMGANRATIVWEVLVPEALPALSAGFTVTLISLIGESAVAGAVGAGGLGDLAIRYGYQRFETNVMIAVVLVLIAFVCSVQFIGDRVTEQIDHR